MDDEMPEIVERTTLLVRWSASGMQPEPHPPDDSQGASEGGSTLYR